MKYIILFFALSLISCTATAQYQSRNNEAKLDADYYMMMEEYDRALKLYLNVLESEPQNADIKYKIGICYLNSESEKKTAIEYLEEAAQQVSEKYNPSSFKEMNAPVEAYFLLGSAYRVNNQLDKAIDAYTRYKSLLSPRDEYNNMLVDQYIRSCHNALEMLQNPVRLLTTNLGDPVNNEFSNFNPVVSGDGNVLAYTSPDNRQGYEIFSAIRTEEGIWGEPKNITSQLGGSNKYFKTSALSHDGTTLYLILQDPFDSEIYFSTYNRNRWSRADKMDKPVNSKSNETHASITSDGNTLFLASDRKGSEGELDIFKSTLNKKGKWSKPVNLGPGINTLFNEDTPFISPDGNTLFFSSEGHEGMGGSDIYRISLSDPAATPVNLGYPINTTDNDYFYLPLAESNSGYFAMKGEDSYGSYDIYLVDILSSPGAELMLAEDDMSEEPGLTAGMMTNDSSDTLMTENIPTDAPESVAPEGTAVFTEASTAKNNIDTEPEVLSQEKTNELPEYQGTEEIRAKEPATVRPGETYSSQENAASDSPVSRPETIIPETTKSFEPKAYTVQLMALRNPVDLTYFRDIPDVLVTYSKDRWFRYTRGIALNIAQAETLRSDLSSKGYRDAFIVKKAVIPNYTVQVMAVPGPIVDMSNFMSLDVVTVTNGPDIFTRYTTGEYETMEEARAALEIIRKQGYADAFVRKLTSTF